MEWQPIDTAPRDGTRILTCRLERYAESIDVCWWHFDHFSGSYWTNDADSEPDPTHWMPLPVEPVR